jgi:hypothetical protein
VPQALYQQLVAYLTYLLKEINHQQLALFLLLAYT